MKRTFIISAILSAVQLFCGAPALGQTVFTIPQATSTNTTVFSGVSTAQSSGCLNNQGQNMHFLFYSAGGSTGNPKQVDIRLEGSFSSDSATCTTGTWFAISDDGSDPAANGNNLVLAIGSYPFIRANLVTCGACDSNDTISANYLGTSAAPGNPFGTYSAGQQIRKVLLEASTSTGPTTQVGTPYGSSGGFVVLQSTNTFTAGTLSLFCDDLGSANIASSAVPSTNNFVLPSPSTTCLKVHARCNACAAGGSTWNLWWVFYPPGIAQPATAQPANTKNSEATATAASATVALAPAADQRAHVFSVSGRCAAGTAQLTVVDTTSSTNLWTSGPTEVSTTTFKFQWNPALAGAPGDTITVTLTSCGVGNVGTLDVQGSVF